MKEEPMTDGPRLVGDEPEVQALEHFLDSKGGPPPPPQREEETPPRDKGADPAPAEDAYVVRGQDVGKTLAVLKAEVREEAPPPLTEKEITILDDLIIKGYASLPFKLGSKATAEIQSVPSKVVIASDQAMAALFRDQETTTEGSLRVSQVHQVAMHLYRYGVTYPSWGASDALQPKGDDLEEGALRARFEDPRAGLESRIAFCMELDGHVIDVIIERVRELQRACARVLTHEALTDF